MELDWSDPNFILNGLQVVWFEDFVMIEWHPILSSNWKPSAYITTTHLHLINGGGIGYYKDAYGGIFSCVQTVIFDRLYAPYMEWLDRQIYGESNG